MKRKDGFLLEADRYLFDFDMCSPHKGWAQVDSSQDAPYYGTWANPGALRVITFAEGDVTVLTAESPGEFVEWLRERSRMDDWKGIDPMLQPPIEEAFKRLGLGDLLH